MKAATLLLVSGVILVSLVGCKKSPSKDAVWNRDNLGAIVELEPASLDLTTTSRQQSNHKASKQEILEIETEEEEEHWCNA